MLPVRHALLALAALTASPQEPAQRIDVALSNFKFTPATIRMKPGNAYILHLSSSGRHSFKARTFFAAAKITPTDRARIAGGKIELEDGDSIEIHLIAPAAGSYPVRCTHFLHADFGMTGNIIVG